MSDLPEPDPIRADLRRERQRTRLPDDPECLLCGVSTLDTLTRYPAAKVERLMEAHHVVGQAADSDLTVVLCRNCHAIQTAAQHDLGAVPPPGRHRAPDTIIERVARALRSLAIMLHALAHTLTGFATGLLTLVTGMDSYAPEWREQGWAR